MPSERGTCVSHPPLCDYTICLCGTFHVQHHCLPTPLFLAVPPRSHGHILSILFILVSFPQSLPPGWMSKMDPTHVSLIRTHTSHTRGNILKHPAEHNVGETGETAQCLVAQSIETAHDTSSFYVDSVTQSLWMFHVCLYPYFYFQVYSHRCVPFNFYLYS